MLSTTEARRTAAMLLHRYGEVAVAAAVLHAQQARAQGRYRAMLDWWHIAEAAVAGRDGGTAGAAGFGVP